MASVDIPISMISESERTPERARRVQKELHQRVQNELQKAERAQKDFRKSSERASERCQVNLYGSLCGGRSWGLFVSCPSLKLSSVTPTEMRARAGHCDYYDGCGKDGDGPRN